MSDFTDLPDLASARLGGAVVAANDEFFASRENLIKPERPISREGVYTERGKWMDGWETRRRREPGHDWCIVRLGLPGRVRGIVVDTTHFRGNFPEACSLDLGALEEGAEPDAPAADRVAWRESLPRSSLSGDCKNLFAVTDEARATHVRLHIYPDGGVARLRVHGEVLPDWERLVRAGGEIDLAAIENGGRVTAASDMFFGSPHNLILPGRGRDMTDGW
jgi:allantoicase